MAAQMQHVAAFSLVAAPLLPAAGKRPQKLELWLQRPHEVPLLDSFTFTYSQHVTWWQWPWHTPWPSSTLGGQWIWLLDPADQWTVGL